MFPRATARRAVVDTTQGELDGEPLGSPHSCAAQRRPISDAAGFPQEKIMSGIDYFQGYIRREPVPFHFAALFWLFVRKGGLITTDLFITFTIVLGQGRDVGEVGLDCQVRWLNLASRQRKRS